MSAHRYTVTRVCGEWLVWDTATNTCVFRTNNQRAAKEARRALKTLREH